MSVSTSIRCTGRGISDQRYERLQASCPECGEDAVRIVYGFPSGALIRAAVRGQVVLGGCTHRDATHRCPRGHEFHQDDLHG